MVPSLTCIEPETGDSLKGIDLLQEVKLLHTTAAGKQIVNLFQTEQTRRSAASKIDGGARALPPIGG